MITVLVISCGQTNGQDKADISFGIGLPEAINIGARYQINQSQIGGSIGWWPGDPDAFLFDFKYVVSISGDYYYHIGRAAKYSDLRPWYVRVGINCWLINWRWEIEPIINIPLRMGRDIYLNSHLGFSLDAGVMLVLMDSDTGIRRLLPSFGIRLFHGF